MAKYIGQIKSDSVDRYRKNNETNPFYANRVYYAKYKILNPNNLKGKVLVKLKERVLKVATLREGDFFIEVSFLPGDAAYETSDLQIVVPESCSYERSGNIYRMEKNWVTDVFKKEVLKLGVQGDQGLNIILNGELIKMGKNGLFEIDGIEIKHLCFMPRENEYFLVDYECEE